MYRSTLVPSAVITVSGSSISSGEMLSRYSRGSFLLDVTAAATVAGDTLDVFVQKQVGPESAPVWTDIIHFTQCLGNGGVKQHVAELCSEGAGPTTAMHVVQDAVLAAGVAQGPWGDRLRFKWVVVGTGSFTFSVNVTLEGSET